MNKRQVPYHPRWHHQALPTGTEWARLEMPDGSTIDIPTTDPTTCDYLVKRLQKTDLKGLEATDLQNGEKLWFALVEEDPLEL